MEKTVKKLLVATGLVASAAVALLPLTSYAAQTVTGPGYAHGYACDDSQAGNECARANQQEGGPTVVTVNVAPLLAIDAVNLNCTGANDTCVDAGQDADGNTIKAIQAYPGMVRTGTLTARVRSAMPFTISLSAEDPYLKGQDESGDFTGYVIPSSNEVDGKKAGWGVQQQNAADGVFTNVSTQPKVFYTSDVAADDFADFPFVVGVSADSRVPQGYYTTEITVTAATIGTN